MSQYVHGYTKRESTRLDDQASTLAGLLHHDSKWGIGEVVLEAGCGVGSQTKIIAANNPQSSFVSVDIAEDSLEKARALTESLGLKNVDFRRADIFDLPFEDDHFDHVLVCFVLEHLLTLCPGRTGPWLLPPAIEPLRIGIAIAVPH